MFTFSSPHKNVAKKVGFEEFMFKLQGLKASESIPVGENLSPPLLGQQKTSRTRSFPNDRKRESTVSRGRTLERPTNRAWQAPSLWPQTVIREPLFVLFYGDKTVGRGRRAQGFLDCEFPFQTP